MVPAEVDPDAGQALLAAVSADPTLELTVDVDRRTVSAPAAGIDAQFTLDDFTRDRLLAGMDDIDVTMRSDEAIAGYEGRRPAWLPRTPTAGA
jgi:3-isopropylmalate/(R)-2-methylmalate dehydratase small subunit